MPFTPAAQRTRSPPVRYHPGARPGNRDGASDLGERGRLSERTAVRATCWGAGGGRGQEPPRQAGHRPQRLPLLPFPAPLGLVSLRGDGGWGGTVEGREAGERNPWQNHGWPGGDWEEGARRRVGRRASRGRERGPAPLDCCGHAVPQHACLSRRVVPYSGGGDRSAWRVSGFLAPTPSPNHSEKTHVVAADNCA